MLGLIGLAVVVVVGYLVYLYFTKGSAAVETVVDSAESTVAKDANTVNSEVKKL